jgi:hypothetical protein
VNYRSSISFLGLPLLHVTTGNLVGGSYRRGVAIGWFAIGDIAMGVLFACGGIAFGGVCVGGAAFGALSIGGFAIGLLALGGAALGIVAIGGAALAWYAALGGLAVARDYAIGGLAHAPHVIAAAPSGSLPLAAIPHPPFTWSDALLLLVIVIALLAVAARSIAARRRRSDSPYLRE